MDVENANCKLRVSECADMEVSYIERPIKADREIDGLEVLVAELRRVFAREHVHVPHVQALLASYASDARHWRKYAKHDRFRYTRNLVDAGNGSFNVMVLCWAPQHASAIHDHADSHCFMKILSGSLQEVRYDWPQSTQPEVLKKLRARERGTRCTKSDDKELSNDNCQNNNCHNLGGKGVVDNGDGDSCRSDGTLRHESYQPEDMVEIGRTTLELNDVCYINDAIGLHRMENPSHVDSAVSLHLYCPPFDSCRVFDARTGRPTTVNVTFTSMYGKRVKKAIEPSNVADSQQ